MSSSTTNMQNTNQLQPNFPSFGNLSEYSFSVIKSHQSIFSPTLLTKLCVICWRAGRDGKQAVDKPEDDFDVDVVQ